MSTLSRASIFQAIEDERIRQDAMFGAQNADTPLLDYRWLAVIGKTFGDVNAVMLFMTRDKTEIDPAALDDLEENLVQVAASSVQMLEKIQQYRRANS